MCSHGRIIRVIDISALNGGTVKCRVMQDIYATADAVIDAETQSVYWLVDETAQTRQSACAMLISDSSAIIGNGCSLLYLDGCVHSLSSSSLSPIYAWLSDTTLEITGVDVSIIVEDTYGCLANVFPRYGQN